MNLPGLRDTIAMIADDTGADIRLDAGWDLVIDGRKPRLPERPSPAVGGPAWYLKSERQALLGTEGALPSVPRADLRDRLLWVIVEDSLPDLGGRVPDAVFHDELAGRLPDGIRGEAARNAVAEALRERFFARTDARTGAHTMLPVQTDLPAGFAQAQKSQTGEFKREGYRLFSGLILPFMLWHDDGADRELIQELLDAVNSEEGLTQLDRLMLDTARDRSRIASRAASADVLLGKHGGAPLEAHFGTPGDRKEPFSQESLDRFRRDLATVLRTDLARTDRISWIGLLLGFHISLLLMRLAHERGGQVDSLIAAAGGQMPGEATGASAVDSPGTALDTFRGAIRFRVGTGGFESVSLRDPCHTSWKFLVRRRLMGLLPALITSRLTLLVWEALGGPAARDNSMTLLTQELGTDDELRIRINAATRALAAMHHAEAHPYASREELYEIARVQPGPYALAEEIQRSRRSDLRRQGRDVINQLMLAEPAGRLLARNGPVDFFEVDETLLTMLVHLACENKQLPLAEFLDRLADYGLAPQHAAEEARIADVLERLGFLTRYSDSGEAAYVHAQL